MPTKQCSVIGSGPNGLAAAIRMAQADYTVTVYEAHKTIGGGCRSEELTLPGFVHDICSAIHPLALGSPYFRTLSLHQHGLRWVHPDIPLAHPLDDGTAALLDRSVEKTAGAFGEDERAYRRLIGSPASNWDQICRLLLRPSRVAGHPVGAARFGLLAIQSAKQLADRHFTGIKTRAILAGLAAHSFLPLDEPVSAGFGLSLAILAHAVGWPLPRGGSQEITRALTAELTRLGGKIETDRLILCVDELENAGGLVMADVPARALPELAGGRLPDAYERAVGNFGPGPGVYKIDYALESAVPWSAKECLRAGTVHLGGTFEEIAASESAVGRGECPERPFVLVAQQSLFDPSRASSGKQTLWAYCHVPRGSTFDMTDRIEAQIERFAPGFARIILERRISPPAEIARHSLNCPGGDITGGAYTLAQMIARPALSLSPWSTGNPNLFLCSASTPPGGGVHGMCGYYAAQAALGKLWR